MKTKCEICGEMVPQQDMSKSYKHRCKKCVARLTRIDRLAAKKEEEITYEYKFFKYSYSETRKMNEELNALSKEGWEIASLAGEDHFYAYFILKREILHTSKED